ncbi:MAG: hypothetical protein HeimAB125_12320 [Candidatus Heimdallarchaeota archaeon AB_125]|nr:MAG: hypothetical protein HeimAB125_12320 [Candidatus Heimdallarchaeota archaeon AB_125]
MSELDKLKDTVPDVVSGFVRYAEYNAIPETLPIKNKDILLPLLKRLKEAGSNGCLFYLYDEDMVSFLNTLHSEIADFPIMLIVRFGDVSKITALLEALEFEPFVIFLDYSISDQRDNEIVLKYSNAVSKFTQHVGIFSIEPIGTVSFFITANPNIKIYLTPFNMLGFGVQNRSLLEMIVNSSENVYITMNPLAQGRVKSRQAFDYITTHRIHGALIEIGDVDLNLETVKFAKYFFETHDFLQIALEFEVHSEVCDTCGLGMYRYYPPTGGSWFYCPQCQAKKEIPKG